MSEFNILFWLLIVMLCGIVFAIENGVAARHKRVVACSALSVLAAAVVLMFLEEERWKLKHEAPDAVAAGKGGGKQGADDAGGDGGDGQGPIEAKNKLAKSAMIKADAPTRPSEPFTDCDVCPSMTVVPRGSFRMGSHPNEAGHRPEEAPTRTIHIPRDFAVSRFEITRDQYAAFAKETERAANPLCTVAGKPSKTHNWLKPGFEQGGRHAVVCITREDANAYVAWLSKKAKKSFRLLSEAEWEYAARAGATSPYYHGDTITPAQANFGKARDGTIQGGYIGANRFGLFDTFGNAWEMVADCWSPTLAEKPEQSQPEAGGDCGQTVIRGGAFDSTAAQLRLAARAAVPATNATNNVGLRVARAWDPKELKELEKKIEKRAEKAAAEAKKPSN